jgi:hypothetical protein
VGPVGKGLRSMIYEPGSTVALHESPSTLERCTKEAIIAEAECIVDARGVDPIALRKELR